MSELAVTITEPINEGGTYAAFVQCKGHPDPRTAARGVKIYGASREQAVKLALEFVLSTLDVD